MKWVRWTFLAFASAALVAVLLLAAFFLWLEYVPMW